MTTDATSRDRALALYEDIFDRKELLAAYGIEGIETEIAVLRVAFRTALAAHKEDVPLILKCMNALVRAAAARYRMAPQDAEALQAAYDAHVRPIAELLMPREEDV